MKRLDEDLNVKLNGLMSYSEYYSLVQYLAETSKTTGTAQSPDRIFATKLNAQRMKRLEKQCVIHQQLIVELSSLKDNWNWVIIAESWCGDGAQNIPVIAKLAKIVPSKISLQVVLRDENPTLMDAYMTNSVRAIPKLVCFNKDWNREIGVWGPRPAAIQQKVNIFKHNYVAPHDEFVNKLHTWYAEDKGESLQMEFEGLVKTWNNL